jgi:hypothetical protein
MQFERVLEPIIHNPVELPNAFVSLTRHDGRNAEAAQQTQDEKFRSINIHWTIFLKPCQFREKASVHRVWTVWTNMKSHLGRL